MEANDEKFCEYRDPDYFSPTKRFDDSSSGDREAEKLKAIIKNEFRRELQRKERTLATVDERLLLARKTFHKLRYAVVNNFYNAKKFELNSDDIQRELSCVRDPKAKSETVSLLCDEQKRLHPALKKVVNEKLDDVSIDISPLRPVRKRFKPEPDSAASTLNNLTIPVDSNYESLRSIIKTEVVNDYKNDQPREVAKSNNVESNSIKIPMYIGPKDNDFGVLVIDPVIRNKQKKKFRIIIGNTSKYITPTSKDDFITHRWLLYIRGPKLNPDISHIVDSITIQLHDSYAPQNIIKLKSSPFHLSKRGWGEFPVKLRLHFKNEVLNKPVNIIHNLKLDRYHTGMQTLGGETVIDVWLYTDETMEDSEENNCIAENKIDNNAPINNLKLIKSEPCTYYEDLSNSKPEEDNDVIECVNIKEEPMDIDENVEDDGVYDEDLTSMNVYDLNNGYKLNKQQSVHCENSHVYNDHSYFVNTTDLIHSDELENDIFHRIQSLVNLSYFSECYERFGINITIDNVNFDVGKFVELNKSLMEKVLDNNSNCVDKDIIVDNVTCVNIYLVKQYIKNFIALFESGFTHDVAKVSKYVDILKNVISINNVMSSVDNEQDESLGDIFVIGQKVLNTICAVWSSLIKIKDMRCAINIMLKNMPLIDQLAGVLEYKKIFPYVVASDQDFFNLDVVKRRNLIWTRAKLINNFLRNFFKNNLQESCLWSTKQIMIFGQYHGYFPIRITADSQIKMNNINRFISMEDKVTLKELFDSASEINSKTVFKTESEESVKVKIEKIDDLHSFQRIVHDNDCYYISDSSDDEIEVCDNLKEPISSTKRFHTVNKISDSKTLPFNNNNEMLQCKYIERVIGFLGLEIRSQNVGNGYVCSLIHKMILAACKSFIEDVIRRSLCIKIDAMNSNESIGVKYLKCMSEGSKIKSEIEAETNNVKEEDDGKTSTPIAKIWNISESGCENEISLRHIFEALKTRKEFDFLTNYGVGLEDLNYNGGF